MGLQVSEDGAGGLEMGEIWRSPEILSVSATPALLLPKGQRQLAAVIAESSGSIIGWRWNGWNILSAWPNSSAILGLFSGDGTAREVWRLKMDGELFSSPVLCPELGMLTTGCRDNFLYAFHT